MQIKQWIKSKMKGAGCRNLVVPLLLLLPACSTAQLTKLEQAPLPQEAYQKELTVLYRDFALQEAKDYDWADSQHFAKKGLQAAKGAPLEPEDPAKWRIPTAKKAEMQDAHIALRNALATKAANNPTEAARAQFYYDCWVEEQEENWQTSAIRACRDSYLTAMDKLGASKNLARSEPKAVKEETIATPSLPPVPNTAASTQVQTASYMIPFTTAKAQVNNKLQDSLKELASNLQHNPNYVVIINGHTDSVGDATFNYKLAEARAQEVRKVLSSLGVKDQRIQVYSFGESDPRVPTSDNVSEAANRRVEVYVTSQSQLAMAQ